MMPSSADWPYPFWIAHRGAGADAPENTMAAFRLGASRGFEAFECDVKLSADGTPFLLHDDTLERTTNGVGVAGHHGWADLARLDAGRWHSEAFAGEPLPTLETVLRWVVDNRLNINLELKPTPGLELETGRRVAAAVASFWSSSSPSPRPDARPSKTGYPLLSSFRPACLEGANEVAPHIPRALLIGQRCDSAIDDACSLGCKALVFKHSLVTQETIRQCHDRGLRVLAYTVNESEDARRLASWQIDGLITDNMASLNSLP